MPNETELKLLIDPAHIRALWRHPLLNARTRQKLRAHPLLSVYYDTPERHLHNNKSALRLRQVGKRWIQTIKTAGTIAAGLHHRPEWEQITQPDTLRLDDLRDPDLRKFFADENLCLALQPVFTTQFSRSRRMLDWPDGDSVEFALDRGEIRSGEHSLPIVEIELELKAGKPGRLYDIARALQQDIPIRLSNVSKAERGYRLADDAALLPKKPLPEILPDKATAAEACVIVIQDCVAHLQFNAEGVEHTDLPEFVHQVRVATRRLRAALKIFSALAAEGRLEPLRQDLRWLGRELNGARNWDVFATSTLPLIQAAIPDEAGLAWLAAQADELRQRYRARAREAVCSARFQRVLLDLGAWLADPAWRQDNDPPEALTSEAHGKPAGTQSAQAFGASALARLHRKIRKRVDTLATLTPEERHAVRIAAKKLRYASQFFASLYPARSVRKYLSAVERLQDVLGEMNDTATTAILLNEIQAVADVPLQNHVKGIVLGWAMARAQGRMRSAEKNWQDFIDCDAFWRGN